MFSFFSLQSVPVDELVISPDVQDLGESEGYTVLGLPCDLDYPVALVEAAAAST